MFNFFRKGNKISETKAVATFLLVVYDDLKAEWESIRKNIQKYSNYEVENSEQAIFEIFLALTALENQALSNLYPKEQANRVIKKIKEEVKNMPEIGNYGTHMLGDYEKAYENALDINFNPIDFVACFLIKAWFDTDEITIEIETVDPILLMVVQTVLVAHAGYWKRLKDKYKLVEG